MECISDRVTPITKVLQWDFQINTSVYMCVYLKHFLKCIKSWIVKATEKVENHKDKENGKGNPEGQTHPQILGDGRQMDEQ